MFEKYDMEDWKYSMNYKVHVPVIIISIDTVIIVLQILLHALYKNIVIINYH